MMIMMMMMMMITIVNSQVVCEDNGTDVCVHPHVQPVPFVCDDKGVDERCQTVTTSTSSPSRATSTSSTKVETVQSGGEMIDVGKWLFMMVSVMIL